MTSRTRSFSSKATNLTSRTRSFSLKSTNLTSLTAVESSETDVAKVRENKKEQVRILSPLFPRPIRSWGALRRCEREGKWETTKPRLLKLSQNLEFLLNSFKNWVAKRSSDRASSPVWGLQLGRIKADHLPPSSRARQEDNSSDHRRRNSRWWSNRRAHCSDCCVRRHPSSWSHVGETHCNDCHHPLKPKRQALWAPRRVASGRDRDRRWNHARCGILRRPSWPPKSFSVRDSVTGRFASEMTGHKREGEEDEAPSLPPRRRLWPLAPRRWVDCCVCPSPTRTRIPSFEFYTRLAIRGAFAVAISF